MIFRKTDLKVWLLHAIILFFVLECRQAKDPTLANVGEYKIKRSEFIDAYRFTPGLKKFKDDDEAQKTLLLSMIAEKLLARYAEERNLHTLPEIEMQVDQFEREAIIEKFWEEEIFREIEISDQEMEIAVERAQHPRVIQYLTFETQEKAMRAFQWYLTHGQFEDVAALQGIRPEQIPVDTIRLGSMLPNIEERVFSMQPDSVAKPVREGRYYFLIRLIAEIEEPFTSQSNRNKLRESIKKNLRKQRALKTFQDYINKNLEDYTFSLNKAVFKRFVELLEADLKFDNNDQPGNLTLLKRLQMGEKEQLDKAIVQFSEGSVWTAEQLLIRLAVSPYPVNKTSAQAFRNSIISVTRRILNDQLLVRHARDLGIHETEFVLNQKQRWQDHLLYKSQLAAAVREVDLSKGDLPQSDLNQAYDERIESLLIDLLDRYPVNINYSVLDTLTTERANMVVFKTHFPNRMLNPAVQIVPELDGFVSHVWKTSN